MTSEPSQYCIVVLDIEDFSGRPDPVQRSLRAAMYEVVRTAVTQAGIAWSELVTEDRGDGMLLLVPPTVSPVVLAGAFVRALHDGLAEVSVFFSEAHAMRFRVALHQGLVTRDAEGCSGDAVNAAFRYSDAPALRAVLKAAVRAHLAFIVSDEIYQGVVRHNHRTIDAAAYLPVSFTAKHGVRFQGWVFVPGHPAPPGLAARDRQANGDQGGEGYGEDRSGVCRADPGGAHGRPGDGGVEEGSDDDVPGGLAAVDPSAPGATVLHADTVQGDMVARDKVVTVHSAGRVRL